MKQPAAVLALAIVLAGCESTGPDLSGTAQLAIAPVFPATTLAAIEIREAQVVLERLNGRVAVDQTITVEPGALDIELTVELVLQGAAEDFNLSLVLLDQNGRELYRSAPDPQRITIATTGQMTPISVPMEYTGPGFETQTLEITGADVPLTPAAPVTLEAQPRDASGNLVSDAPLSWRTRDPGDADLVELEVGTDRTVAVRLIGDPPFPSTIDIIAETPNPLADTASLAVEELFGRYDLISVNGEPLPVFLPDESQILSGVAQLNAELTWAAEIVYDFSGSDTSGGTFSVSGSQITLVDTGGGSTTGELSDGQITVPDPETADVYVFRRTLEFVGLTVAGTGDGAGTVTSAPSGIDCTIDAGQTSSTCQADFGRGQLVRLEAVPDSGSSFSFWSPQCGESPICDVTLDQSLTLTASFTRNKVTVTIVGAGSGGGTVVSDPAGIDCQISSSETSGTCIAQFNQWSTLTLAATPAGGSTFTGWSGACSGAGPCQITLTRDTTVAASFSLILHQLTVGGAGAGSGTITGDGGINCRWIDFVNIDKCDELFQDGTVVTLTTTPDSGSAFIGWTGDCSGTGQCQVTMTQPRNVIANFAVQGPPIISNLRADLITLNQCGDPFPDYSRYQYTVDYTDPDGDVTPSGTRVFVELSFSNESFESYESDPQFNTVTGDGFSGTVTADNCLLFGSAVWVDVTLRIWDAAGRESNRVTTRVDKPAGAN